MDISKKFITRFVLLLLAVPHFGLADLDPPPDSGIGRVTSIYTVMLGIINFIWPIFGGVAIIMFIVAGFLFLTAAGNDTKISTAKHALMWGIIGVAVALLSTTIPFIVKKVLGV